MTSHPWDADRELTTEMASAAISACFPAVDVRGVQYLGSGWDFDAYATTDGWAFRFPRRAQSALIFDSERRVHDLVSRFLPRGIAVPRVELMGQPAFGFPHRFAGHRLIRGVTAERLVPDVVPAFARDLGIALGSLHSIPEAAARDASVVQTELDDIGHREWFARGLENASKLRGFDPLVDHALRWAGQVEVPVTHFPGPPRFIHQDLVADHVIVDPETGRIAGIIDWTDAILGDPARDFVFLLAWRGWSLVEAVMRSYPGDVDPGFRDRLRIMARLLTLIWLGDAHEAGGDVAKHTASLHNAFAPNQAR